MHIGFESGKPGLRTRVPWFFNQAWTRVKPWFYQALGARVILKTYSEVKNYKRKIEMCKFAYTTYEKVLTHLRSFMRGLEYNEKEFLDHVKVLDEIIIEMCPLTDKFEKKYNNVFI